MQTLELLSPAKTPEFGIEAVNHGADAVYIGANAFGARKAAGNSIVEIEKLITYAHKFGAKVYITLNTILYDSELDAAQKLVYDAYSAGADALIVQDMSLLMLDIPPIPLHASTQTHNYELEKIVFLQNAGFERIILARELSLSKIRNINANTTIELEHFIHGALCVCYSGQCYFSHAVTGKSANRGKCSQPCRMKYNLSDSKNKTLAKNKYLLSLKDMNLSEHISDLIEAGIKSFKIEGRLKDIDYLKNVTAFYRQKFDEILEGKSGCTKSSKGKINFFFTPDLDKTFNRTYTDYFFGDKRQKVANINTPKSLGELLGEIKLVKNNFIELATASKLNNGDGICYFDSKGELAGFNINKFEGNRIFLNETGSFKLKQKIYRNYNHEFSQLLTKKSSERFIEAKMELSELQNGFKLAVDDFSGNSVEMEIKAEKVKANKSQREIIEKQLSKSGGTIFKIADVKINFEEEYFIPMNILNEMRREILALLEAKILEKYKSEQTQRKTTPDFVKLKEHFGSLNKDYRLNISNSKAKDFYSNIVNSDFEDAFELQNSFANKLLMTTKHCIKFELNLCPIHQVSNEKISNPLYLENNGKKYRLEFDCKNCEMKIYNGS